MKNPTQKAILSIMGPEPMSALDIANQINFPRENNVFVEVLVNAY